MSNSLVYTGLECRWGPLDGAKRTLSADDVILVALSGTGHHLERTVRRDVMATRAAALGADYLGAYVIGVTQTPRGSLGMLMWLSKHRGA